MSGWPKHPMVYEINTAVWLGELGKEAGSPVTLATVPGTEWDRLALLGCQAIWLMGVWERSPAGLRIAAANRGLLDDFRRALPDFTDADNIGSPYCVHDYRVATELGGPQGLEAAREELARRGMKLLLDFVPNHVAPDHPWVSGHPEYFLHGSEEEAAREPAAFLTLNGQVFACGCDPYFPAWPDVLQLNVFNPALRAAVIDTISAIADQCDGVRCDMAMLVMNHIFQRTWGERAGAAPPVDYWPEVIGALRSSHPDFLFMAEAYWDLEWDLQQQGFHYCYDKKLFDRLEHGSAEEVRLHLCADMAYQQHLVRFIENHDEPRAASAFPPEKARVAALFATTLPGAALLHEGQFEGRKVRLPVFLGRRPDEPPDTELQAFYSRLLGTIDKGGVRNGAWRLCERQGWPDNQSYLNMVAWCWEKGDSRHLIVVNLSDHPAQARIQLPWDGVRGKKWHLVDLLSEENWERDGDELAAGLYVELSPWGRNFFRLQPP